MKEQLLQDLLDIRDELVVLPSSRPLALTITKIEEAAFWLNAAFGNPKVLAVWDSTREKDK